MDLEFNEDELFDSCGEQQHDHDEDAGESSHDEGEAAASVSPMDHGEIEQPAAKMAYRSHPPFALLSPGTLQAGLDGSAKSTSTRMNSVPSLNAIVEDDDGNGVGLAMLAVPLRRRGTVDVPSSALRMVSRADCERA